MTASTAPAPHWLPALHGVVARLEAGAKVADTAETPFNLVLEARA